MASNKKTQKAGEGSKLVQADGDVHIHEGPSYTEIIGIVESTTARIVKEYIPEAHRDAIAAALQKGEDLTRELAERFSEKPDDLIEAFKDPSFNYDWGDATRASIESNDDEIEKVIIDLIENRISTKDSPRVKIVTSTALRAAGQMGADARNGLALIWWIGSTYLINEGYPFEWYMGAYIARLKGAYDNFPPPEEMGWIDDLDMLDLLRKQNNDLSSVKQFFDITKERFVGYLVPGVADSELERLIDPIKVVDPLVETFIMKHPLKEGFSIIASDSAEEIRERINEQAQQLPEFDELIAQNQFGGIDETAIIKLKELLQQEDSYRLIEEWWNAQMQPCVLTKPGRVVAYSLTKNHVGPLKNVSSLSDLINQQ